MKTSMTMKSGFMIILASVLLAGCADKAGESDAYGTFEATEVTVSAETSGRIISFPVREGEEIAQKSVIALIDTTLFHLQKSEIDASMNSVQTRMGSVNAQNEILQQQIENIQVNVTRTANMLKEDAATRKQYDDLTGQIAVLEKQINANKVQKSTVAAELMVLESKKATLNEQILRCMVKSPLDGSILEKYAEEGELTVTGRPLVKIADLRNMKLKVYVSGAQLGRVHVGSSCTVRIDDGIKGFKSWPGKVSNVSDRAEFTPKIIQTKEERVTLVYAVTIEVKNDGSIKSGMPGEAIF
jgi:HlyD family secretion protein